jgi:uncharacterized protein YukE/predicted protein tyrosine phosphatase
LWKLARCQKLEEATFSRWAYARKIVTQLVSNEEIIALAITTFEEGGTEGTGEILQLCNQMCKILVNEDIDEGSLCDCVTELLSALGISAEDIKNCIQPIETLPVLCLKVVLEPTLSKYGLEWVDIEPILEHMDAKELQEELQAAIKKPERLLEKVKTAGGPAAKKLAIMCLKPSLQPLMKRNGLEWTDVVPVLEAVDTVTELHAGCSDLKGFLKTLAEASEPAKKKLAIMWLKPTLEPDLREHGLEWTDVVPVLEAVDTNLSPANREVLLKELKERTEASSSTDAINEAAAAPANTPHRASLVVVGAAKSPHKTPSASNGCLKVEELEANVLTLEDSISTIQRTLQSMKQKLDEAKKQKHACSGHAHHKHTPKHDKMHHEERKEGEAVKTTSKAVGHEAKREVEKSSKEGDKGRRSKEVEKSSTAANEETRREPEGQGETKLEEEQSKLLTERALHREGWREEGEQQSGSVEELTDRVEKQGEDGIQAFSQTPSRTELLRMESVRQDEVAVLE